MDNLEFELRFDDKICAGIGITKKRYDIHYNPAVVTMCLALTLCQVLC